MNSPPAGFVPVQQEDVDFLGTDPVPAKAYYDPDWYELERQAVFLRSWINMGHSCELPEPGDFIHRKLEFAAASLLIVRGKDGEVRAFHNACTHRGTRLVSEAQGHRSSFTCPYHSWTFGKDGALLSAPDFDGFHVTKEQCALKAVRTEVVAGMIFVNLDADAASLRDELGDFADEMETLPVARATEFSEYTYEIEANWKIVYDNFQENYHLRFIHPRSGKGGIGPDNPFGYPSRYRFRGTHRGQTLWFNPEATPSGPVQTAGLMAAAAALTGKGLMDSPHGSEYFGLFPTLFMLGVPFQNFSHVIYPLDAGRTRGVIRLYWVGEAETASELFARHANVTMMRDLHSEDIDVIEDGYAGLASGAIEHIHFQTQEALCRHLYNTVTEKVRAFQDRTANEAS
ncbi:MAG: aromatic ring-hydroxylating dioxygenase subunit alpha [Sphingomonadaceae bacterium]|nr:aromatic ring-hydroxylating dioxygenase subunit alpha [Sphingomonadaceae bacterium]